MAEHDPRTPAPGPRGPGPARPPAGRAAPGAVPRWAGFAGVLVLTAAAWLGVLLPTATVASTAAGVAGMGVTVVAWGLLGRAGAAAVTGRTVLLWCAPLVVAPPLFSRDVFSYLAQGAVAARGANPNLVGPAVALGPSSEIAARVDGYWREVPSPYGPLAGAVQRTVHRVTAGDPVTGILLHRLTCVVALLLVVWALRRLCARSGVPEPVALWLGVLNPLVLWHLVAGVHNDALMLGLGLAGAAVALAAADGLRWGALAGGIALIVLGAVVKLPVALALPVVAIALVRGIRGDERHSRPEGVDESAARWRCGVVVASATACATVWAVVVAAAASVLTGLGFGWVAALGTTGSVDSWMAPSNWPGYLAGPAAMDAGRAVGAVLALAGVVWVLVGQARGRLDDVTALGVVVVPVVVFGPVVQPWYLLWAVVPLAAGRLTDRWRVRIAVVVAVFAVLVPPLAGTFTDRVGQLVAGYGIGLLVTAGVAVVLLRTGPGRVPA